jgi:PAS domain S-box-containing protein
MMTTADSFEISKKEQVWLDAHSIIRVGIIVGIPPYSMVGKDGKPEGIDPEIIKYIDTMLPGKFSILTGTHQKLCADVRSKKIDILMCFTSAKKSTYLNYTRPYMSYPHVIVAKDVGPHLGNLSILSNQRVALEKDSALIPYLQNNYPNIRIRRYKDSVSALKAVKENEAQAYIGSKYRFNYLLFSKRIEGLGIHSQSNETAEENVIAVRKDWPTLTNILDRALGSIPHNKFHAIVDNYVKTGTAKRIGKTVDQTESEKAWIKAHPEILVRAETSWGMIWRVALAFTTLLLFTFFWSRKMSIEVKRRKKAELSLIEDAVKLKRIAEERDRILNMSTGLICIVSMDGYLKYASPSCERILGYTKEELFSRPLIEFVHPDDRTRTSEIVYNLETVKDVNNLNNKCICKDGSLLTISWITTPLVDEDAIYCTGRDITERIQSEKAVKESEKKYKAIFDSSGDSIAIIDFDTGSYIDCNKASLNLFNLESREQFISNTPGQLSPEFQVNGEPSHELAKHYIEESFNQKYLTFEWIHSKGDGTDFDTFVTLSSLVVDGKKLVMAIVRDITDSKNAEKEREKMIDELQEALESIKTLSGLVPICSNCKKIRDDEGYWNVLEAYIEKHSNAFFSHGICGECTEELYGEEDWYIDMKKDEE